MRCAHLLPLAIAGFALAAAGAEGRPWPRLDGEMGGDFRATTLPGAPVLHWKVQLRRADGNGAQQRGVMAVDGEGVRLRGELQFDETGGGRWTITEGTLDAAVWLAALAPGWGPAFAGVSATGRLAITGGGEVRSGRPSGTIALGLTDGTLRSAPQGWSLEGISLRGEFAVDAGGDLMTSVAPCEIGVRTISSPRFGARNFSTRARLSAGPALTLTETRIEVAGGEVTVAECTWPLAPLAIEARLRIKSVGLQDIAAFVPAGLSDARGRISGEVGVAWSEAQGFQLGSGTLDVTAEEPAMVRLAASPGFLTKRVPKTFELIPGLGRWFKAENPAYADLSAIELGQGDLSVESLSVRLTPEGDERGRTASVLMTARPAKPTSAIGLVTFEVNVAGPLTQALRLGLNQSFSIEMR